MAIPRRFSARSGEANSESAHTSLQLVVGCTSNEIVTGRNATDQKGHVSRHALTHGRVKAPGSKLQSGWVV